MNARRLKTLFETHGRKNCRDAFGEHRFAGAGRTDQKHVVAAGHCDFNRAFSMVLPAHFAEVFGARLRIRRELLPFDTKRLNGARPIDEVDDFRKSSHRINGHSFDDCGFARISGRHQQVRNLLIPAPASRSRARL